MSASIGFRPTSEDERILREAARPGETTTDTLRRALRLLDHERWLERFRADAKALKDEDVNAAHHNAGCSRGLNPPVSRRQRAM